MPIKAENIAGMFIKLRTTSHTIETIHKIRASEKEVEKAICINAAKASIEFINPNKDRKNFTYSDEPLKWSLA